VSIRLDAPPASERVQLAVWDTGPGPGGDVGDAIFEPLVSQKADGVGLGLSVAREVVDHHGGRIRWFRRDQQTCFEIDLPRLQPGDPHGEADGRG
jgi:nitrogen-specific signal transduction histidine kinase